MAEKMTEKDYIDLFRTSLCLYDNTQTRSIIEEWNENYPQTGFQQYLKETGNSRDYDSPNLHVLLEYGLDLDSRSPNETLPTLLKEVVSTYSGGVVFDVERYYQTIYYDRHLLEIGKTLGRKILERECTIIPVESFPSKVLQYIDFGCGFPARLSFSLAVCLWQGNYLDYINEGYYLPIKPTGYADPLLVFDTEKIDYFLATLRPETLVCRCSSFGFLDYEAFRAILNAENKNLARRGEDTLTEEQLFRRLPPYLQKSDRMTEIAQNIAKTCAADSTILQALSDAGKNKPQVLE